MEQLQKSAPLFDARIALLKNTSESPDWGFKFGGIASSETVDAEGDAILRKMLDISYISRRGYVNWDHQPGPESQIGYTTKAVLVEPDDVAKYEDLLQVPLTKSVSLYVEGQLYKHSQKAQEVANIMKSIPVGAEGALGLSVEGGVERSGEGIVRALVRGVAVTHRPAHPEAMVRLVKSIGLELSGEVDKNEVGDVLIKGLSFNDAIVKVLELRPNFTYKAARRFVQHVFDTQP